MPRLQRLPSMAYGWYYIAMRAVRGRQLIFNAADLSVLVQSLLKALRVHDAHLHAAAVTPREIHLVIQNSERAVYEITRRFCNGYARRFNRSHTESGSLFQSHPRLLLIDHRIWLVPAAHVVHWIPRLRECSPRLCWTTEPAYRDRGPHPGIITHTLLNVLTHASRQRAVREAAYRERFDRGPNPQDLESLARGSADDSRILGDGAFVADTLRAMGQRFTRPTRSAHSPDEAMQRAVMATLAHFADLCEGRLPPRPAESWRRIATLEHLRSRSRQAPLPLIRALAADHAIENAIATQAQIAAYFGCHPKTLSAQRRRHAETRLGKILRRQIGRVPR